MIECMNKIFFVLIGLVVLVVYLVFGVMLVFLEIEFVVMMMVNVYYCWMVCGMVVSGLEGMGLLDVLVLYFVNYWGWLKILFDICLVLNIEDIYIVIYVLKKLEKFGLIIFG